MDNNIDNVNSVEEDSQTAIVNKLPELPTKLSKRQLKRVKRREMWLEHKSEKRLGNFDMRLLLKESLHPVITIIFFLASLYSQAYLININISNIFI